MSLAKLKKFLKENATLDDNLKFTKFENGKLFALLDSGQKIYWVVNPDFTVKNIWYYLVK